MITLCTGSMTSFLHHRYRYLILPPPPPAIHVHVFLNSRIFRGVKPIFRLCPSLGSNQPSPPKLDFGSALFLILLFGQVELNPGPPMSGNLNLSSIFPCGYSEDSVTWEKREIYSIRLKLKLQIILTI